MAVFNHSHVQVYGEKIVHRFFLVAIIGTLFFRAWSKILNFSDDQVGRPEKAAVLWKWLIERLRKAREKRPESTHLNVSYCRILEL